MIAESLARRRDFYSCFNGFVSTTYMKGRCKTPRDNAKTSGNIQATGSIRQRMGSSYLNKMTTGHQLIGANAGRH